ncbi:MAG: twin-arginine translocation signal domain-containing protein [Hyphomicrobiaceae bacterium]
MATSGATHHAGLARDLTALISRRRALGLLGAAGTAAIVSACDGLPFVSRSEAEAIGTGPDGTCVAHPVETAGPFPADGSNRAHGTLANVLDDSGIVRRDIRSSVSGGTVAQGVDLQLTARLVDVNRGCMPLANHVIYLWHCDAEGKYSVYDLPKADYLRGVGVSDADGQVVFTTIFPGCYQGRAPHMHFEVYPDLKQATSYKQRLLTSQLAIPTTDCKAVYERAPAYRVSLANLARTPPVERDGIFADNTPAQLKAQTLVMTGSPDAGYLATVTIGLKT